MELALHADALPPGTPIEETIRAAALTGFPWLLFEIEALDAFLGHPDFDIRDREPPSSSRSRAASNRDGDGARCEVRATDRHET